MTANSTKGTTALMNLPLSSTQEVQAHNTSIPDQSLPRLNQQQAHEVPSLSLKSSTEPEKQQEQRAPERVLLDAATENLSDATINTAGNDSENVAGEYVLGETIGKGTFGKVKLGIHLLTGEKVAVKILEKKRIIQAADVDRVAREIKILKRNRHPNVVQLYEVIDSPDNIYLIMEHVDGGEMFEYIVAHRRIRETEAAYLFCQIMDGLAYLHVNEVTHRDLKPENLLLQSNRYSNIQPPHSTLSVKIVDFGLSNMHDGGRLLRTACGSPCYAAPEMIQGRLYRGPVADVWSLGVVLFAMVCGFLPFEDSNTNMLYKKILSANYTMPTFLSANVQDLIRRILETDPEKRYTVDQIRQHPWLAGVQTPDKSPLNVCEREQSHEAKARHEMILNELEAVGLPREDLIFALAEQSFNRFTASYYLLDSKIQRTTRNSILTIPGTNPLCHYDSHTLNSDKVRHQNFGGSSVASRNTEATLSIHSERRPFPRHHHLPQHSQDTGVPSTQRPVTPNIASCHQENGSEAVQRSKSMRGGRKLVIKNESAEASGAGYLPIAPLLPREHLQSGVLTSRKPPGNSRATVNNGMILLRPLTHLAHPPRREFSPSTPRRYSTDRQIPRTHMVQPSFHLSNDSTNGGAVIRRRPQPPLHHASRTQNSHQAPVRPTPMVSTTQSPSASKLDDTRLPLSTNS